MRKDGREMMLLHEHIQRMRIAFIEGFDAAPSRVARKELKRIRAKRKSLLSHRQIAVRAGQMTTDMQHHSASDSVAVLPLSTAMAH